MTGEIDIPRRSEIQAPEAGMAPRAEGMPAPVMVHAPGGGLVHILWRRKLIILICLLLSVAGAFAYLEAGESRNLPWDLGRPVYISSSRIYVQQSGPRIMSADEGGARASANYLNNECQVMRSGRVLSAALAAPGITDMRTFAGAQSPISLLNAGLSVAPGKSDDLITVSFESYYPEDTAAVTNAVVDAYVAHQSTQKRNTAIEILGILQKEKVKRDGEIEESLAALLKFKREHPELGFQGEKGNTIIQKLDRLSSALTEAELQLIDANADYQSVMSMKDDPAKIRQFFEVKRAMGGVFVSTHDEASRLQAELTALRLQNETLKRQYPTSHPAVQFSEKRIADVTSKIQEHEKALAATQFAVTQQLYNATLEKYQRTKAAYDEQLKAATGLNSVMAEYARLENAWQKAGKLAEVVDQRIRELNVTEDVGALNISVLERADGWTRSSPNPNRVAAISVALGVLAGVGLALLRNGMDKRLVSAEEVSEKLGVPVLGVLPRVKAAGTAQELGRTVLDSPSTPIAEAYRAIRTTLRFGSQASGARKILITSPMPGEGKSTLVSNVAILMAQAGQKVLVVDADLRWPHQHEIFQVSNDLGLAGVLLGLGDLGQAICRSAEGGPDVLPAGHLDGNPSEVLNTLTFLRLMDGLGDSYDTVLVDSPPVMLATDSLVLAAVCDGTILVLRSGRSNRDMAHRSIEGLLSVGARVLGAVVNGLRKPKKNQGYYPAGYYPARDGAGKSAMAAPAPSDGAVPQ